MLLKADNFFQIALVLDNLKKYQRSYLIIFNICLRKCVYAKGVKVFALWYIHTHSVYIHICIFIHAPIRPNRKILILQIYICFLFAYCSIIRIQISLLWSRMFCPGVNIYYLAASTCNNTAVSTIGHPGKGGLTTHFVVVISCL
jgi:hypothetical protein